jgi:hypothetical protein
MCMRVSLLSCTACSDYLSRTVPGLALVARPELCTIIMTPHLNASTPLDMSCQLVLKLPCDFKTLL